MRLLFFGARIRGSCKRRIGRIGGGGIGTVIGEGVGLV